MEQLTTVAGSLQYCWHPELRERGYRAIDFKRHQYVMLYLVDGRDVYIEAIYHQRQDYETVFAAGL
ncbi:MAG: hypothetical protein LUE91_04500 [Oscillospiraceae bacterium]|nr:hypothetical protein [Oscillospiraceae bacterium]